MIQPDKIYQGRSTIRMYNCDCMELMDTDTKWDLAICDVQYGINQDGRNNHTRSSLAKSKDYRDKVQYDNEAPSITYFERLFNVSNNQIVWGANHFMGKICKSSSCWVVWDKLNGNNDFADCELAWASFDSAVRKFSHKWHGMLQHNMKNKQDRIHPNEKPIRLYRWLLNNYAEDNDTILDTHGGSMSLAIACWEEGFDLDICELDKDYFNDAVKRFENHIAQTQLF